MKNLLFPCSSRIVGWMLFVPTVIMDAFFLCGLTGSLSGVTETVFNDVAVIGIALEAMFIVCSEEPNEDEMAPFDKAFCLVQGLLCLYIFACSVYAFCQRPCIFGFHACQHGAVADGVCRSIPL